MANKNNYYINSFFWSTFSKVLNAIFGFISIPLLLDYYGMNNYGILSLATACNGYMHLLDLGMNVGTINFFSQWKAEGKINHIYRIARTNITFYLIISTINIVLLIALAQWGAPLFSITESEFAQLQVCLYIIALFSVMSWSTTTFNQLLVADKQISFTMKMQSVQAILKMILIVLALFANLSLTCYFFWSTCILSALLFPYAYKCKKDKLIDSFKPSGHWKDFKTVLTFSLSIFILSLFQMTATHSRPILLGIFSTNGADTVAEFRIIEVIPMFIIMVGGTFASIFLPKASELVAQKDQNGIENFAYKWTRLTSILANVLCIPFILCANEVLSAYVGNEYSYLGKWLILWCLTVLIQIHTTPGNSLVLAYGKTRLLIIITALTCIFSMFLNAILCSSHGVGSAIIGYFIYVIIIIGLYYAVFYKKIIKLSRKKMFSSFFYPTIISLVLLSIISQVSIEMPASVTSIYDGRISHISVCLIKTLMWIIPYLGLLTAFRLFNPKELK